MFRSKRRAIVFPQAEHGRLAGIVASLWGNDAFDRPLFDFGAFVIGVANHDRGYGLLDDKAIGGVSDEVWLQTQHDGILATTDDPISNIVSLIHIRRLLAGTEREGVDALLELANEHIEASLAQTDYTIEAFEWADRITRVCDGISFDFCFEDMATDQFMVYPRHDASELVAVNTAIDEDGVIHLEPWTLSVPEYSGFIIGYEAERYPYHLEPIYVPFRVVPW